MGTTANYAWPYPASTDAPDVPTDMKDLADAIDTTVDSIDDRCDGYEAAWTDYATAWTATSNPALGNGTLTSAYRQVGKTIDLRITLTAGSTTTFGSGSWTFSLPVTARSLSGHSTLPQFVGHSVVRDVSTATYHRDVSHIGFSTTEVGAISTNGSGYSSSNPYTWATGDHLALQIRYEAA